MIAAAATRHGLPAFAGTNLFRDSAVVPAKAGSPLGASPQLAAAEPTE